MFISIVIPVFNESNKILIDLRSAISFFKQHNYTGEIIVVDDGSTDETASVINRFNKASTEVIHLISYKPNKGKGYAVRSGIAMAKGDIVLFIDSGNCVPYKDVVPGIRMLQNGQADIAHASRFLRESKIVQPRSFARRFFSWAFRTFIKHYAHLPESITDSQCGLKIYKGEVAKSVYSELVTEGFLFDIEIILRATSKGYFIREFPIHWTPDSDSRLNPFNMMFRIWPELRKIKVLMKL